MAENEFVRLGVSDQEGKSNPKRPRCPFYGFAMWPGVLMDQSGNQCALAEGYCSCQMEFHGMAPDWETCIFYNTAESAALVAEMRESPDCTVNPKEHWPHDQQSWAGLPFGDWFNFIVEGTPLPTEE